MKTARQVKIVATSKGLFVSYVKRAKHSHYCAAQFSADTPLVKVIEWVAKQKHLTLVK